MPFLLGTGPGMQTKVCKTHKTDKSVSNTQSKQMRLNEYEFRIYIIKENTMCRPLADTVCVNSVIVFIRCSFFMLTSEAY